MRPGIRQTGGSRRKAPGLFRHRPRAFLALLPPPAHILNENVKGVIPLSAIGYIQVHAFSSKARYPLKNVAITITADDGTAIAMRLTDRSGTITPIAVPVPDKWESQSPNPPEKPFTNVNLYAHLQGYEQVEADNVQVFADITTNQNLELIPLSEFPADWNQTVIFNTPPQNL